MRLAVPLGAAAGVAVPRWLDLGCLRARGAPAAGRQSEDGRAPVVAENQCPLSASILVGLHADRAVVGQLDHPCRAHVAVLLVVVAVAERAQMPSPWWFRPARSSNSGSRDGLGFLGAQMQQQVCRQFDRDHVRRLRRRCRRDRPSFSVMR